MLLYTEKQLEALYKIYARHQNRNGIAFMKLEDFRKLFEEQQSYLLMQEMDNAS
jgi:hypothetical protein|tara:strand:- start:2417 stop:2578 length:162 start_codon:yes stop_codon:yes gene_type:complete